MIYCINTKCKKFSLKGKRNCSDWNPQEECGFIFSGDAEDITPCQGWAEPDPSVGRKNDFGKARWDLLPYRELEEVVGVLTFGAEKYADNNWQNVTGRRRYIAAALRHIVARLKGEYIDPESGLSHLSHAVCNILFLMWHDKTKEVN